MRRFQILTVVLLLALGGGLARVVQAAPPRVTVLVVYSPSDPDMAVTAAGIMKRLKELRSQAGYSAEKMPLKLYYFDKPDERRRCEKLQIGPQDLPFLGVVRVDAAGDPVEVLNRLPHSSDVQAADAAFSKVQALLGVTSSPPPGDTSVGTGGPRTVRVSTDGKGDFPTLEEAVAAAPAGSTIHLGSGVFRLTHLLQITKPVKLVGEGKDLTTVVGEDLAWVVRFDGPEKFIASDMTFEHRGTQPGNVIEAEAKSLDLDHCRFSGGIRVGERTGSGVQASGHTVVSVVSCEAVNNQGWGLVFLGSCSVTVRDCGCSNNRLNGLAVASDAKAQIVSNRCNENGGVGIQFEGAAWGVAQGNECQRNHQSGISVGGNAHPEISGNKCNDNGETGIVFLVSSTGLADHNECLRNQICGIAIQGSAHPDITGNKASDNVFAGITFLGSATGNARDNECTHNRAAGISVQDGAHPELTGNRCSENYSGIAYLGTASGRAVHNQCQRNVHFGFDINPGTNPQLEGNQCSDNPGGDVLDRRK